ncbi:divergent polysaccharide deacetylase family protein [Hyphococcus lacteus]|uniref:Divergent polysaccharide deacetylase family protein n=1 Tax=Hyphococcus lacteus TaxID=3143536 RepID=A0ABV3Z5M5_9PROT
MTRKRKYKKRGKSPDYAGNAGFIATIAIAFAGIFVGSFSAYLGQKGATATATMAANPVRTAKKVDDRAQIDREKLIARILAGEAPPERLTPPKLEKRRASAQPMPKIIIIIDDMGIDRRATERAIELPGPITFSFLPYGKHIADLTDAAHRRGAEIMLHLPMEPKGAADPGPHALLTGMTGAEFLKNLEWNLSRFDGYVGVNNHMGSKLTADIAAMKTLLSYLNHKDVFFVDSVTDSDTAVRKAAREIGVDVFSRDVFLDDTVGDRTEVKKQLVLAERIARETGYVVAIGHPRKETLDVLGPWLTTAEARGFELAYVSALETINEPISMKIAGGPTIRF